MKTKLYLAFITVLLAASNLLAATLYVSQGSTNSTPPYTSWATAAANIQDAVNLAATNDVVVVTNGVYFGGVGVTKHLALLSVNGPQLTLINGGYYCVSLDDGASLTGFTLTGGGYGGGVRCSSTHAFLTNCVLTGNSVWPLFYSSASPQTHNVYGGGVYQGTLYNCTIRSNSASGTTLICNDCCCGPPMPVYVPGYGGGAYGSTLFNCTLTDNSSTDGAGGADHCTLYNCIAYANTSLQNAANYDSSSTLYYCCTMPPSGVGNIALDPKFVDYANGNLRLQSNSPCINAGNNVFVGTSTDLDGRPRIIGSRVDMGAYEFEGPFDQWLQQYGLPTGGSADFLDSDNDGMNNYQEWVCGTCPTNAQSVLRLLPPKRSLSHVMVAWQSVAGVHYFLQRTTDLALPFTMVAADIVGGAGTTSYLDNQATGPGPLFYRVGVSAQ